MKTQQDYDLDTQGKVIQNSVLVRNNSDMFTIYSSIYDLTTSFSNPTQTFNLPYAEWVWTRNLDGVIDPNSYFKILKTSNTTQDPTTGEYTQTQEFYDLGTEYPCQQTIVVLSGDDGSELSRVNEGYLEV